MVSLSGNSYDVAAIDFAFSMNFPADGGAVVAPSGPAALLENPDATMIEHAVERIEAATDEQIRAVIERVPDELLDQNGKDQLVAALCIRRGKIREAMKTKGWLP